MTTGRMQATVVAAGALLAATAGTVWAAGGPGPTVPGPGGLLPTTTTSAPRPTTTASRNGAPTTTSTTAPATSAGPALPGQGTGVSPDSGPPYNPTVGTVPPDVAAFLATVHRSAPNNDGGLLLALRPLVDLGLTPVQAAVVGMDHFPVAGYSAWKDDFYDPRFGPDGSFHFHGGEDLIAGCGTPLRSPTDGVLTEGADPAGGYTVEVTQPDRTYFYLAHLSAYVAGLVTGQHVRYGDVIGFVGSSGAATGCHLHLEVHPYGGAGVDPKPVVDGWVTEATARAPALIDAERAGRGLRPLTGPDPLVVAPPPVASPPTTAGDRQALLWAAAANPNGGALALAEAEADEAVTAAGADRLTSAVQASVLDWSQAELEADALLDPLTPPALRPLVDRSAVLG